MYIMFFFFLQFSHLSKFLLVFQYRPASLLDKLLLMYCVFNILIAIEL